MNALLTHLQRVSASLIRNGQTTILAISLLANIEMLLILGFSHSHEKDGRRAALAADDEQLVRESVYDQPHLTASPEKDFHSILVVPESLSRLYQEHPEGVLDQLLVIVEGASARDSVLAAGYAISLLKGPGVGIVCVEHFDKNMYDRIDKDWGTTPRDHWIERVKTRRRNG